MRVLIDTNVLSETSRPSPSPRVLRWLDRLDEDLAFISVVSIAEIRQGIRHLDRGRRQTDLSDWLETEVTARFSGRILDIDLAVALAWGDVMDTARRCGAGLSSMDGWIAATAVSHDLAIATRNTKDFTSLGVRLVDPWA